MVRIPAPQKSVLNQPSQAECAHIRSDRWYRAMTLAERSAAGIPATESAIYDNCHDDKVAKRALDRWREQPPFNDDQLFLTRLAADGLEVSDVLALMTESDESLCARVHHTPAWLDSLRSAFVDRPADYVPQDTGSFLNLVGRLASQGFQRLKLKLTGISDKYAKCPFEQTTVEQLCLDDLSTRLGTILNPTLVLELNVARLEGRLDGDSPQDRFQNFSCSLLSDDVAIPLLSEYNVLARLAVEEIDQWVSTSAEFFSRLASDWSAIRDEFSPGEEPGMLVSISGGAGDRHRGGRSVIIAQFSSGLRIVYKPRSLSVDLHFQDLLTWLNRRGATPTFRTLAMIDRGQYGWAEFVDAEPCQSHDQVQKFYQRMGAYVAVFYALEGTDMHSENLIAAGEHPMPIDLETLFHRSLPLQDRAPVFAAYEQSVAYSVLKSGLLPQLSWSESDTDGVDISAIGGRGGNTPDEVPSWYFDGTDEMSLQRQTAKMPADKNRPVYLGQAVEPLAYAQEIEDGFSSTYRLFETHAAELLSEAGPINAFAQDDVRVVLRATRTYSILLRESFHPDLMRNALDRDRHFDRLWTRVVQDPGISRVVPAERADCLRGDIPFFTSKPNSLDLFISDGARISSFFDRTAMSVVHTRLSEFGKEDLQRQIGLLRGALSTLVPVDHAKPIAPQAKSANDSVSNRGTRGVADLARAATTERLLEAAIEIGDTLVTSSIHANDKVIWSGLRTSGTGLSLAPTGADLYSGLPGIALFLAQLGRVTEEARYTECANGALNTLSYLLDGDGPPIMSIGAFSGWGGVIYALSHLGTLWQRPDLLERATDIAAKLPPMIDEDEELDIISGAAGCIGGLLGLHSCQPTQLTMDIAIRCGDKLLRSAQRQDGKARWKVQGMSEPLTGFSHGAAGIAWALAELGEVSGETRFLSTAHEGIAFERSVYSEDEGNWPDYRESSNVTCAVTWCHGAPGIGLSRLRLYPYVNTATMLEEIENAVTTTTHFGFKTNHSLCHGALGNLELLLEASRFFDSQELASQVTQIAGNIMEDVDSGGWECGIPLATSTPGLMTGIAGIGYGLLRLAAPHQTPSILALDPPHQPNSKRIRLS